MSNFIIIFGLILCAISAYKIDMVEDIENRKRLFVLPSIGILGLGMYAITL